MRMLLHQSITANEEINETEGVGGRIWQNSALGVGDVPEKPDAPFILYNELPSVPYREVKKTSRAAARRFQVYVYDEAGSFLRIERILALVRETLLSLVGEVSPSGARCTDVEWVGNSMDLTDPSTGLNYKYASFRFVASQ